MSLDSSRFQPFRTGRIGQIRDLYDNENTARGQAVQVESCGIRRPSTAEADESLRDVGE